MNNKELAKKIVESVNEEKSNYDAIDRVEEMTAKYTLYDPEK